MGTLAALVIATPIWGFALQPPLAAPAILPDQLSQVGEVSVDGNVLLRVEDPRAVPAPPVTPAMEWTRSLSLA